MKPFDDNMREFTIKFLRERAIAEESLTQDQLANVLLQAIASGDFIKQVRASDSAQNIIYIPFAESEMLKSRIERLESVLEEHKIKDPDDALEL